MIALVEQQIQRAADGGQPRRVLRVVQIEQPRRPGEHGLAARDPFLGGGDADQERRGDLLPRRSRRAGSASTRPARPRSAAGGSTKTSSAAARRESPAPRTPRRRPARRSTRSRASRLSSGANVRAVRSFRMTSSARFRAVVISHADGLSGTPRTFHTSRARQNASCTTSSASARLWTPNRRVSAATRRPDSRRKRCSSMRARRGVNAPERSAA